MVPRPLSEPLVLPGGRFQVPSPSLGPHWAPQLLVGLLRPTWWPPICPHFPLEVPDLPCPTLPPPQPHPIAQQDAEVVRTRDPQRLAQCNVVVDVGGEYDPERHRYDHHQR